MIDRTTEFMDRIEAHLATLPDDQSRLDFLKTQSESWQEHYRRWVASEGESEPSADPKNPPTAFDFALTVGALGARLARLQKRLEVAS